MRLTCTHTDGAVLEDKRYCREPQPYPQKRFTGYVGMGEGGRGSGFRVLAQQTNQQREHTVLPLSSLTDRGSVAVTFPGI